MLDGAWRGRVAPPRPWQWRLPVSTVKVIQGGQEWSLGEHCGVGEERAPLHRAYHAALTRHTSVATSMLRQLNQLS